MAQQQVIERKTRQQWAAVINADWRKSIESIIQTGQDLLDAKDDLRNGQFGKMLAEDLDFSHKVAHNLMAIARHPQIGKSPCRANLPKSWSTLYQLSRLKEEDFRWAEERGLITDQTSKGAAIALNKARTENGGDAPVVADTSRRNLPSPSEAKSIAKETGRIVAASAGASDEAVAAYKDHRDAVFAIADAIKLINEQPDPKAWWEKMRFWWKSDFSADDTKTAANWLRGLSYVLRDDGHE